MCIRASGLEIVENQLEMQNDVENDRKTKALCV